MSLTYFVIKKLRIYFFIHMSLYSLVAQIKFLTLISAMTLTFTRDFCYNFLNTELISKPLYSILIIELETQHFVGNLRVGLGQVELIYIFIGLFA